MKLKKTSMRERVLLGVAVTVVLLAGYALLRYQPAQTGLARLTEERDELANELTKARVPRPSSRNVDTVLKELAEHERTLADTRDAIATLEQRFVDAESHEAIQRLMVDVSGVAQSNRVTIREAVPYSARASAPSTRNLNVIPKRPSAADNLVAAFSGGGPYTRPLRQLTVEGNFAGIRRFVEQLSDLPKRVIVLQFTLETAPGGHVATGEQLVRAGLVVAL